jgi:hydroxymethylglutaryl-CoA lyase
MTSVQLIECPRDAIQGWPVPVSTADKIAYYKALLDVGFHTLDIGSFVSHKAVPQMKDTRAVLNALDDEGKFECDTRVLVITANARGAKDAVAAPGVTHIGFPLSISNTFQLRNTGADIERAWERLQAIRAIAESGQMKLVVYLSMGFGNPYGDAWSTGLIQEWVGKLDEHISPEVIALSDTIGNASANLVNEVFTETIAQAPKAIIGAHLHAGPLDAKSKIQAAWDAGCRRFDGALGGVGGCPMAQDDLIGNLPTERLVEFLKLKAGLQLNERAWNQAQSFAVDLFQ